MSGMIPSPKVVSWRGQECLDMIQVLRDLKFDEETIKASAIRFWVPQDPAAPAGSGFNPEDFGFAPDGDCAWHRMAPYLRHTIVRHESLSGQEFWTIKAFLLVEGPGGYSTQAAELYRGRIPSAAFAAGLLANLGDPDSGTVIGSIEVPHENC